MVKNPNHENFSKNFFVSFDDPLKSLGNLINRGVGVVKMFGGRRHLGVSHSRNPTEFRQSVPVVMRGEGSPDTAMTGLDRPLFTRSRYPSRDQARTSTWIDDLILSLEEARYQHATERRKLITDFERTYNKPGLGTLYLATPAQMHHLVRAYYNLVTSTPHPKRTEFQYLLQNGRYFLPVLATTAPELVKPWFDYLTTAIARLDRLPADEARFVVRAFYENLIRLLPKFEAQDVMMENRAAFWTQVFPTLYASVDGEDVLVKLLDVVMEAENVHLASREIDGDDVSGLERELTGYRTRALRTMQEALPALKTGVAASLLVRDRHAFWRALYSPEFRDLAYAIYDTGSQPVRDTYTKWAPPSDRRTRVEELVEGGRRRSFRFRGL